MQSSFTDATASTRSGEGRYAGRVHDGWDIGGNANGGYLLALAGRAMAAEVGRPPISLTAHYLRPGPVGECETTVEVVRRGGRLTTASGSLSVDGEQILALLGTFGDQHPVGDVLVSEPPVDLPPYQQCVEPPPPPIQGDRPTSLVDRLAIRLRPGDEGFRTGYPSGRLEMAGWFAMAQEDPVDAFGLLLAADAFAPAVFNSGAVLGWTPTVELTVHVRAEAAPGPLACCFRSRFVHGGMLDEEGEIWDSRGVLVAQSRQLALLPRT